ncbi:tellurite resistance TerB family protein [Devosia rhodophyticola]|uniref:Tellurite resistance TerB family protein n=1 Tax=Devosia rhodophyticola TaxID=3026423 RepID=A0ABY7Z0E4_9HYPH|nr:tellurite resistance TerB family protein [Devosia rhodophyticola]WDR07061.1 tellurite resistance TerB family protein [Devosia rhodophyticola]
MPTSAHEGLIHLMVVAAASDSAMSQSEWKRVEGLVGRMPVFEAFDSARLAEVANNCVEKVNGAPGLDGAINDALAAIPAKLQDTAYALAVEITALDLHLSQEELRFLEMLRDRIEVDRLTTAAIETAARARYRRMPG